MVENLENKTETLADWQELLHSLYSLDNAQDWDNPGLQVGRLNEPVSEVYVCLDITEETILDAASMGADLIISHHPLLFKPLSSLSGSSASGYLTLLAARLGVNILAAHTNFDARKDTTSFFALSALGITDVEILDDDSHLGLIGTLEKAQTIGDLAQRLKEQLPSPWLRLGTKNPEAKVERVACVGGAGHSLATVALKQGAQLFISADFSHHVAQDLQTLGLSVIDAGHFFSENPAMEVMAKHLEAEANNRGFNATVHISSVNTDPWSNTSTLK